MEFLMIIIVGGVLPEPEAWSWGCNLIVSRAAIDPDHFTFKIRRGEMVPVAGVLGEGGLLVHSG